MDSAETFGPLRQLAELGAERLAAVDPELYSFLEQEQRRQAEVLSLVAAMSLTHPTVLACCGSVAVSVTTEGYPGARYHAGSGVVDEIERIAVARAKEVFGARYANVQPHSGSQANECVLFGLLRPGDKLLGMQLRAGGHLTHGHTASVTGDFFEAAGYGVDANGRIDFDQVRDLARRDRPKLLICGGSSYPRTINFARFREIADEVGAWLLADISHISGLVAAGLHPSPIDHAHFTTTSTYKQLGGPRGGLLLMGKDVERPAPPGSQSWESFLNRAVFPRVQGTPDLGAVAAKARALGLVASDDFRELARRIVSDARALAERLADHGYALVTGGTDNHMVVADLRGTGLTGIMAERALEHCGIVVNRNGIPGDDRPPSITSGLRFGTNIAAARGLGVGEMAACADLIHAVLSSIHPRGETYYDLSDQVSLRVRSQVRELCSRFPLPAYPRFDPSEIPTEAAPSTPSAELPLGAPPMLLHAAFERQAAANPDAVAISFEGRDLSYGELNSAANRLASHLRDHFGIGPEDRVGLMLGRSERLIIGILGILKVGAAYVPIDLQYPAPAVREMITDAAVSAFLVDSTHVGVAGASTGRIFVMDLELEGLSDLPAQPIAPADPSNAAYVIYTSGSTGRRKGVVVEHRAIVNTLEWRRRFYKLDASMTAVQIPSCALDSSVVDLFSTLGCGGRLILIPERSRMDVRRIERLMREYRATHLLITPTLYALLLSSATKAPDLAVVTLAGEPVPATLVERHFQTCLKTRLVNEYGPTENAVCSTAQGLLPGMETVSMGDGITGVEVHLLDDDLQPVADGEDGEIYLEGAGLARGYVGRPALTADRFVPNHLNGALGSRLYRTGDRARRLGDRTLEFIGRQDDQVKIRGHRVELAAVEHALRNQPGVTDAVASCRTDLHGHQVLVGYVVPAGSIDPLQLRNVLSAELPGHMVPDAIVGLDRVPMMPSGKVDRASLPDCPDLPDVRVRPSAEPRTPAEEAMAGLWARVLDVTSPGIDDDFFALGGNSLKAVQLQLEIHTLFGVEVPLHKFLDYSTIARLVAEVAADPGAPATPVSSDHTPVSNE